MADALGVAVIGLGNAGLEHARAFRAIPGAELVAVVDADPARAAAVEAELGLVPTAGVTLERALNDPRVDAVVVATPSDLHAGMAVAAAAAGKHLLLEKPPGLSLDEIDTILAATQAAGVRCQVNMVLRWHPMIEAVRAAVAGGRIGRPTAVEVDFVFGELEGPEPAWARVARRSRSVHLYAGCHAYDQFGWLTGARPTEVSAVSSRHRSEWEYDVTSIAVARLAGGVLARATVTLEAAAPYRFGVRVFGTRGTIVDNQICVPDESPAFVELCPERVDVTYLPFDRAAADFVAVVRSGRDGHASLAATRDVFAFALDAERAAAGQMLVRR